MSIGFSSPLPALQDGGETPDQVRARNADAKQSARAESAARLVPTARDENGEPLWGDTYLPYPTLWHADGRQYAGGRAAIIFGVSWGTEK